jgi:hypothetical protein
MVMLYSTVRCGAGAERNSVNHCACNGAGSKISRATY